MTVSFPPRALAAIVALILFCAPCAVFAEEEKEDLSREIEPYINVDDPGIHAASSTYSPENIPIIYSFLTTELGLSTAAACGVLANIHKESSFDPGAIGDGGEAYGICQWNSRRNALINFCASNGYGDWTSLAGQLNYMKYELENSKKSTYTYLKGVSNDATGAYNAAYYFCVYYEIPANRYTAGATRGALAVNTYWANMYNGSVARYTVSYDANGGENAPASQTKTEGVPLTLTSEVPSRAQYAFAGWATAAAAAESEYEAGGSYAQNANLSLFAVWVKTSGAEDTPVSSAQLSGHRYELYKSACTWTYASDFAKAKGGYLATVTSRAEMDAISSLIVPFGKCCWLGGYFRNGNWLWQTGEGFNDALADAIGAWSWGEPTAVYGYTGTEIYLAQTTADTWSNLPSASSAIGGFVVEYGQVQTVTFPVYKINVSSSLNVRSGPGTGYAKVGSLYNGTLFTITETVVSGGNTWGYGYTSAGLYGWCAMVIPDYMVLYSGASAVYEYTYEVVGGKSRVTGYTGGDASLTVPDGFEGAPLTEIAPDAFIDQVRITDITLPDGVKTISSGAFSGCTALASVTVPGSVTDIAAGAFPAGAAIKAEAGTYAHAYAIANRLAFIPITPSAASSVSVASEYAYIGLPLKLSAVTEPNMENVTWTTDSKSIALSPNGTAEGLVKGYAAVRATAGNGVFAEKQIQVIDLPVTLLPKDVTTIERDAFRDNTALVAFSAEGGSLTAIEEGAFAGCTNLALLTLPDTVRAVAADAIPRNAGLVLRCPASSWVYRWATDAGYTVEGY